MVEINLKSPILTECGGGPIVAEMLTKCGLPLNTWDAAFR